VAGRLYARPSAYVEEGRMTSGGMTPHRLSKSIEHLVQCERHAAKRWIEQEVDSEEKDEGEGKDDKELVKQQGWYWKPSQA